MVKGEFNITQKNRKVEQAGVKMNTVNTREKRRENSMGNVNASLI